MNDVIIQEMSDLHWEFHEDHGIGFVRMLDTSDTDVLVLAGDICTLVDWPLHRPVFSLLLEKVPDIVYVPGNHEYYHGHVRSVTKTLEEMRALGITVLTASACTASVKRVRFVGGTLWFPDDPLNVLYQRRMTDFDVIRGFYPWVYAENHYMRRRLMEEVTPSDVVVTHHLPSVQCVATQWRTSELNRFFVSDVEDVMRNGAPQLWIHGHTHSSVDLMIHNTRVVCNPYGYWPFEVNPAFDPGFRVKVTAPLP